MAMSPQDQVRQRVRTRLLPQLMLLIYRADKGNEFAKLEDLRTDGARRVYLTAALNLFEPAVQRERMNRVHTEDAHQFASAERDEQDVIRQARHDIERFSPTSNFGAVRPGFCYLCQQRITPADAFLLEFSATLKADVHGACASKDPRCEVMTAFSFRLVEGSR